MNFMIHFATRCTQHYKNGLYNIHRTDRICIETLQQKQIFIGGTTLQLFNTFFYSSTTDGVGLLNSFPVRFLLDGNIVCFLILREDRFLL